MQVLVFLLVFWSPKQVKYEESYEESWANLRSHLPRVYPDCKEKKQRESAMKHILDDSRSSHFWSTFWSPNDACYIPIKAQEVNNPMLQTVCNSELKRRSCSHYKPITLSWRKHFAKCCEITLLLRSDFVAFLNSVMFLLLTMPDLCREKEAGNLKVEANFAALWR